MPRAKIDLVAPPFELPSSSGGAVASWNFKARQPLVLFFPHAGCEVCRHHLESLERDLGSFAAHRAQALALLPASLEDCRQLAAALKLSYPLLADTNGTARARYLEDAAGVGLFVLDRYGEPYGRWLAEDADGLPGVEPLVSALELAELECPECGVPDWS